jgi:hypothetical protein
MTEEIENLEKQKTNKPSYKPSYLIFAWALNI